MKFPSKVEARITSQLKSFQAVLADAKQRNVNEADTGLIVVDMLCDFLGYKKIEEITAEHPIHGQFADFAVRIGSVIRFLVEVKAVNIELKDSHITQVVDYAAKLPVDWVVLTNGVRWQAYKVVFGKPIEHILVLDLDFMTATAKGREAINFFGGLSREVFTPDSMSQIFHTKQATSKYSVAAILLADPVVAMVRREMRKLADGLNPTLEEVRTIIENEVIKRELIESDEAITATKAVNKLAKHAKAAKEEAAPSHSEESASSNSHAEPITTRET